jgi:excisionase family DNA binding protein
MYMWSMATGSKRSRKPLTLQKEAPMVSVALLKAPEVAQILNLSVNQVYELIRVGTLPSVRIETSVRVPRVDLDEWIRRRTQRPAAD